MTPRQRLEILLDHYRDVLEGARDRSAGCSREGCRLAPRDRWLCQVYGCADAEGVLALMNRDWNHASYQQLERLLGRMREDAPRLAWNLLRRFLHYHEVRRAWCRKCGFHPPGHVGRVHAHPPGKSVTLVARVKREHGTADLAAVERAIDWLLERWEGEVELPPGVAEIERERALRAAAGVAGRRT